MKFDTLVSNTASFFHCKNLEDPEIETNIRVHHLYETGRETNITDANKHGVNLKAIPGLAEFFQRYSNVKLFHDPISGDTGFSISSPENWGVLERAFRDWMKDLTKKETEELLPDWLDDIYVFGDIPGTGNYYLMPSSGELLGCVFEFDHDGFIFTKISDNFPSFINDHIGNLNKETIIDLNERVRFIDPAKQNATWAISAYYDGKNTIFIDQEGNGYTLEVCCTENRFTSKEKNTVLAKFKLPETNSNGCTGVDHTTVNLPDGKELIFVCEMTKYGTTFSMGDSGYDGDRLLHVFTEGGFTVHYQIDENIYLSITLEK